MLNKIYFIYILHKRTYAYVPDNIRFVWLFDDAFKHVLLPDFCKRILYKSGKHKGTFS